MEIEAIIAGCRNFEAKAQKALVLKYTALLMGTALRYIKDYHKAEEIVQNSWINILNHFDSFNSSKGKLETWMRKITINNALKSFRQIQPVELMLEEISFIEPMVEQDTFDDLSGEILIQFISELPNGCREVFNLFVIDELSHNEISNLLHITTGSSKSQLSYARKLLQDKIKSSNHIFQL